MTKNIEKWLLAILLGLGLALRLYNLSGLTTFEWDQARDVGVMSEILSGKPTLIGPVVRGQGSFFLGPFYYYLGALALFLSGGHPLGLSLLSVAADLFAAWLLYRIIKPQSAVAALFGTGIWIFSRYLLELSHTPWNVSLLAPWLLSVIWLYHHVTQKSSTYNIYPLTFLLGLSTHIHLTAVPAAAVIALFFLPHWLKLSPRVKAISVIMCLLPLLPLILFDLRHEFLNCRLFLTFLTSSSGRAVSFASFLPVMLHKFDYTFSEAIAGIRVPYLGLASWLLSLAGLLYLSRGRERTLLLALSLLTPAWLLLYRDPDFAEYYLVVALIPLVIGLAYIFSLTWVKLKWLSLAIALSLILTQLTHYRVESQAFSLANKAALAKHAAESAALIDLRLEAPPGRRDGIEYLLEFYGADIEEGAPHIAVVTEAGQDAALIDRTDAPTSRAFGGLKLTVFKKQP